MHSLQGRVVIVTGASAGIGEATARRLVAEGANVVLAARRRDRLQRLKLELDSNQPPANGTVTSPRVLVIVTDVTVEADRKRLVRETVQTYGRIDALVNNAGFGQRGPIERVPIENIRQNFETNLFALIALTQEVIPILREQRSGRIVNVGSVAGKIARPFSSIYDATKHALEAITDGLRGEMSLFGVQVALIQPGYILTEFLEVLNRVSKPVIENAGPYAPYLKEFSRLSERARGIAGRPDDIADLIFRALTDRRPRFRYAAPRHAHLFLTMKRFFPERWFEHFALRQMGLKGN
jgi:NAD(P)-dependent dehydrogenase (short-subunit alcohol dehydrogenase family)